MATYVYNVYRNYCLHTQQILIINNRCNNKMHVYYKIKVIAVSIVILYYYERKNIQTCLHATIR